MARLEEADEKKCERVTLDNSSTEESRKRKETAERSSAEDRCTVIEIEEEHGTEEDESRRHIEVQKLCSGAPILAKKSYKKNPDSPMGKELALQQGDVLSCIMEQEDNEHWWLARDNKGQLGYVPVAYVMIIQEDGGDNTGKERQDKSTNGTKMGGEMGRDGERRNTYSAAVID